MPVTPSSAYQTGAQVLAQIQDLCNDPQGQLFSGQFCVNAMNEATRWIGRELRNRGKMTLVEDEYLVTLPAVLKQDAVQQVYLTFTGVTSTTDLIAPANAPTLPQNLVEPLLLWERQNGFNGRPVEMRNKTGQGGLDKRMQRDNLADWEWRTDMLCFVGALVATDVVMRFNAVSMGFVLDDDGTISGSLGDIDAQDAVAYRASAQLLPKRGGAALGATYQAEAQRILEQLSTDVTRAQQFSPVRMKPYGNFRRGRGSRYL